MRPRCSTPHLLRRVSRSDAANPAEKLSWYGVSVSVHPSDADEAADASREMRAWVDAPRGVRPLLAIVARSSRVMQSTSPDSGMPRWSTATTGWVSRIARPRPDASTIKVREDGMSEPEVSTSGAASAGVSAVRARVTAMVSASPSGLSRSIGERYSAHSIVTSAGRPTP